nr:MAG TPA: hypothetical protein [Caudoviricetes sp.]
MEPQGIVLGIEVLMWQTFFPRAAVAGGQKPIGRNMTEKRQSAKPPRRKKSAEKPCSSALKGC